MAIGTRLDIGAPAPVRTTRTDQPRPGTPEYLPARNAPAAYLFKVPGSPDVAPAPPASYAAVAKQAAAGAAPQTPASQWQGWAGTVNNPTGLPQLMPGMYLGPNGQVVNLPMSAQGVTAAAPFGMDDCGNPFISTAQATDWKERVAARDAALASCTFESLYT